MPKISYHQTQTQSQTQTQAPTPAVLSVEELTSIWMNMSKLFERTDANATNCEDLLTRVSLLEFENHELRAALHKCKDARKKIWDDLDYQYKKIKHTRKRTERTFNQAFDRIHHLETVTMQDDKDIAKLRRRYNDMDDDLATVEAHVDKMIDRLNRHSQKLCDLILVRNNDIDVISDRIRRLQEKHAERSDSAATTTAIANDEVTAAAADDVTATATATDRATAAEIIAAAAMVSADPDADEYERVSI